MRPWYNLGCLRAVLPVIFILFPGCEKQNNPPVADFTFTPITGNIDTVFTFDASGSRDNEEDSQTLMFRWDWTHDGTWDTDFSSSKVISHQFNELRDYTIAMEVKDHKGLVSTRKKAIRVSPSLPVVKTVNLDTINDHSIRIQGEIVKDGGSPVIACGACWSFNDSPSVNDHTMASDDHSGTFYVIADNLVAGKTYYIRTYATNSKGTSYGDQITVTTPGLAVVHTNPISNITINTGIGGGEIAFDGGSPVRHKGVCWSQIAPPEITDPRTMDGNGSENFESRLQHLRPGTYYLVRAYAINSIGVSYGEIRNFRTVSTIPSIEAEAIPEITRTTAKIYFNIIFSGGENILERGVCWSPKVNPTLADAKSSIITPVAPFLGELVGLEPNRSYYARGFATNIVGTGYSSNVWIQTNPPARPTVTTTTISMITSMSAQSGGNITDDGGSEVTERGVCWYTGQPPTINDNRTIDGFGSGDFTSTVTPLLPNTIYYVRAYAVNKVGIGYGYEIKFRTLK